MNSYDRYVNYSLQKSVETQIFKYTNRKKANKQKDSAMSEALLGL